LKDFIVFYLQTVTKKAFQFVENAEMKKNEKKALQLGIY